MYLLFFRNFSHKSHLQSVDSVQFSRSVISDSLQPYGLQHARPPCPSPTPGAYLNSCPLSWGCHPTISFLSSPSPPSFNLSNHEGLYKWVSSSHQVAKVLELQLQNQSFQWYSGLISFRIDCWSLCSPRDSQESSPAPQFESITTL